jgi:Tfp pilus assembly protein PilF
LLLGAEVYRQTNAILAEKLYRRALQSAIQTHGVDSPIAGLVLLSFGDFLESEGRTEEAQKFFPDIRRVCVRIVGKQPGIARNS